MIDTFFKQTSFTTVDCWLSKDRQDRRGQKGREPTVADTFISDLLAGSWGESVFGGPQVQTITNPRFFADPDALPAEVSQASAGQQGAQFEYRYIRAKPNADGLAAELGQVVDEVRTLNLKHVGGVRRQQILDATNA